MRREETKVQQNIKNEQDNGNIKNKRKHNKKFMRVLVYIALILVVLSLLFLVGYGIYHMCTSSKYILAKVNIVGNVKYTYEELYEKADIPMGENLYKISKNRIENNLKELPYVADVKITRKNPDTMILKVKEYVSKYLAYNKETDEYIRLTAKGEILETINGEEKSEDELLLHGINFDDELGDTIVDLENKKIKKLENILKKYEEAAIDKKVTSVEFKEDNVILTLDYDISVILDGTEIEYKLSFLKSILNEITGKAGIIDMTKENPVFTESIK